MTLMIHDTYMLQFKHKIGNTCCEIFDKQQVIIMVHNISDIVERKVGKNFLSDTREVYRDMGYRAIQFYSTELNNYNLICSKVKHILGESDTKKIYARNCEVREITVQQKNIFFRMNHIQGACNSQYNYGLFYDGILVASMTFSAPRVMMNKSMVGKKGHYELVRFATAMNYCVVGAASKLLAHFKRNTADWKYIYSYADSRWSVGNLYKSIGFNQSRITRPDYQYVIDGELKHRWGFRKDELKKKFPESFDSSKTEYQNMLALGYDRVWNAGGILFDMTNEAVI